MPDDFGNPRPSNRLRAISYFPKSPRIGKPRKSARKLSLERLRAMHGNTRYSAGIGRLRMAPAYRPSVCLHGSAVAKSLLAALMIWLGAARSVSATSITIEPSFQSVPLEIGRAHV